MDYITQRKILRRPLTHAYMTPWDLRDLDGGCQVWRRFRERKIDALGPIGDGAHSLQIKQFELTKIQHITAESMWRLRMAGNADPKRSWHSISDIDARRKSGIEEHTTDQEIPSRYKTQNNMRWGTHSNEINSTSEWAIEDDSDSDDDDDDDDDNSDDDNSTIYSRAHFDPPSLHEPFSKGSPSGSSSSMESYVTASCTMGSISPAFGPLDWAGAVDGAEAAREHIVLAQTGGENAGFNRQGSAHPFLINHVQHAWLRYKNEHLSQEIEKNRTLGQISLQKRRLSCCSWKPARLLANLEDFKESALQRPITGRCTYERTPVIILTNEDDENFELREIIQILSDEEIELIHLYRDPIQTRAKIDAARYHYSNVATIEGQSAAERQAITSARAWWQAQQKTRTANYIDRAHDEAREEALLMRQVEREAELYLRNEEVSHAIAKYSKYHEHAKEGQVEALAKLKMTLQRDGLVRVSAGSYVAGDAPYSVRIVGRAWRSCLARWKEVAAMVQAIRTCEKEGTGLKMGSFGRSRRRSSAGKGKWKWKWRQGRDAIFRDRAATAARRMRRGERRRGEVHCREEKEEKEEEEAEVRSEEKEEEEEMKKEGEEIDWVAFMLGFVDDV